MEDTDQVKKEAERNALKKQKEFELYGRWRSEGIWSELNADKRSQRGPNLHSS